MTWKPFRIESWDCFGTGMTMKPILLCARSKLARKGSRELLCRKRLISTGSGCKQVKQKDYETCFGVLAKSRRPILDLSRTNPSKNECLWESNTGRSLEGQVHIPGLIREGRQQSSELEEISVTQGAFLTKRVASMESQMTCFDNCLMKEWEDWYNWWRPWRKRDFCRCSGVWPLWCSSRRMKLLSAL